MSASKDRRRAILGEDGELRAADEYESEPELIYCTRCGTANPSDSNYCRKCGHSLEEQEADMLGLGGGSAKSKRERLQLEADEARDTGEYAHRRPVASQASQDAAAAIVQIMTLLLVSGMGITAVLRGPAVSWAIVPILIGWIAVEAVRGGWKKQYSPGRAIVSILTMLIIAGITITTLLAGPAVAWVVVVLMIMWIVVEAVRG